MKKKLLTLAMAATMVVSSITTAFAAETVECSGWWTAHSQGYEVDEDGIELTFKNVTYADAANQWNGPIYVVYAGDEAKVNGAGYAEYGVARADNYAWNATTNSGDAAAFEATGCKLESVSAPADTAKYLSDLKAGVTCTLKAKKIGNTVEAEFKVAEFANKMTWAVDGSKPVYISISGEMVTISELAEVVAATDTTTGAATDTTTGAATGTTVPPTGDATVVLPIVMVALVAAGAVVVSRKKVTE